MANLIDTSFFYGPLAIAQLEQPAVAADVTRFIDQYEPQYLRALFGAGLYAAFLAGLAANTAKYLTLRDGADFTGLNGATKRWDGLVYVNGEVKRSPIANYVYCHYLQHQRTATTGTGEKVLEAENAKQASPRPKMAKAWNEMVQQSRTFIEFIAANQAVYPEYGYYSFFPRYNYDAAWWNGFLNLAYMHTREPIFSPINLHF